jgi:hypothetical protein
MRTLHHRQIYLALVILAFLLVTPLIIFYAQGKRFDPASNRLVTTGILSVVTEPASVTLSIAGKSVTGQTPLQIRAIIPGRYTAEITRPGFLPWQKSLVITAGQTTFLHDVVLIRDPVGVTTIVPEGVDFAAVSPDERTIITASSGASGETLSRRTRDGELVQHMTIPEALPVSHISFSPSGRKMLVQTPEKFYVVSTDLRTPAVALDSLAVGPFQSIEWGLPNENELFVITQRGLERIDIFAENAETVFPGVFNEVRRFGNQLFALQSPPLAEQILLRQNAAGTFSHFANLPAGSWHTLTVSGSRIFLHNEAGLVIAFTREGQQVEDPAFENFPIPNSVIWSPDERRFATLVGGEVWLGALRQPEHTLVGRYSDPPLAVSFLVNSHTLLLTYRDRIVATDVDGQDPNYSAIIWPGGSPITLVGSIDQQRTLFVLEPGRGRLLRLDLQ